MTAPAYTEEQKLVAVERELGLRRRVYPRRIFNKQMTQSLADYEIGVMEAIVADYRVKAQAERLI